MHRKPTRRAGRLLAAALLVAASAAAYAQAPSVPATGSVGAGKPALAPPGGDATTPAPGQPPAPPPGIPGQPGTLLPPVNATGLAPAQTPPPASGFRTPTRSDTALTAFRSLDPTNRGYVTRAETDRIPGFVGFDNADTNRDGRLTLEEFNNAWKFFAGQ